MVAAMNEEVPRIIPTALHEVTPDKIEAAWPALGPLIGPCIDTDLFDPIHIKTLLLRGVYKLWIAGTRKGIEAIAMVEIIQAPKARCLVIWGCASADKSESERWIDHLPAIEQWAKERYGCIKSRVEGRKGWARKLPDHKLVGYILERTL